MNTRQQIIYQRLEELNRMLDEWEAYRLSARDPGESLRSEQEIKRIKGYIDEYQSELAGKGEKVIEDLNNPVVGPAIRRNNKKWIIGIVIVLFIFGGGYYTYVLATRVQPDYSKYLAFIKQGDDHINNNKFAEATTSYEKALEYNPGDSVATKKITLLRQANRYIEEEDLSSAQKLFQLIVKIPASASLSIEAQKRVKNSKVRGAGLNEIQIDAYWEKGFLVLKISGGLPFDDPGNPYLFDNLGCSDCVRWNKTGNSYEARIDGSKFSGLTLNFRDRAGNVVNEKVPTNPADPGNSKTESSAVADGQMREEQFKGLVESADKFFAANKFAEARKDYLSALQLKAQDGYVKKQLAECEKELEKQELAEIKNLPKRSISGGTFTMGLEDGLPDERPEHSVTIGDFKISQTEVTVSRYRSFCKYTNRQMPPAPSYGWHDDYPIVNVTWEEAQAFCSWVDGRLPAEAEWEYAARDGGGKAIYSGGNQLNSLAIYSGNSGGHPAKVGTKRPNGFQLYDLTGNVSEWCADWYGKYGAGAVNNPRGPSAGKYKIVRGGAFNSVHNSTQDGDQLSVTYRNSKTPGTRENYLGFRVVWDN